MEAMAQLGSQNSGQQVLVIVSLLHTYLSMLLP